MLAKTQQRVDEAHYYELIQQLEAWLGKLRAQLNKPGVPERPARQGKNLIYILMSSLPDLHPSLPADRGVREQIVQAIRALSQIPQNQGVPVAIRFFSRGLIRNVTTALAEMVPELR